MRLFTITGRSVRCVPTALSAVAGVPSHDAAAVIRRVRADGRPVFGVTWPDAELAALELGLWMPVAGEEWRNGHRPTLATWSRSAGDGLWLVRVGGKRSAHLIAVEVDGRRVRIADSCNRRPVGLRDMDRAVCGPRSRVRAAQRVERGPVWYAYRLGELEGALQQARRRRAAARRALTVADRRVAEIESAIAGATAELDGLPD